MRILRTWALALAAAVAFTGGALAADAFPTSPVKVVVPYGAGGTGDVVARILGDKVGAELGQPVVVDNRSGGGGIIGAQAVKTAKPDGYTLLQLATAHVILPSLQQVPYDLAKDYTPVFGITTSPLVFAVHSKSGIQTVADLVKLAKSRPKGLNYASGGAGSISHLAAARLVHDLKISGTHVPFRGFSPAVQALMGDQVDFICAAVADVLGLAKSGDFRLLAVTSDQRAPLLPEVPTMKEQGFGDFHAASWNAWVAPAGTPPDVVDRLNKAVVVATADRGVQERLGKVGVSVVPKSRADLEKFIKEEGARWRKVIEQNGVKLEN
jgi:tripartite-type tricarboxylate transporter receptor subunit TctC